MPSTPDSPDSPAPSHPAELLAQIAALPTLPGVYRYFDAAGTLLYVGKARNLKRRVSSYFHKDHGGTRIGHMVRQIASLQTTVVRTEAEALLLENNLIKTGHPKYNILFRDDKSYPWLQLTGQSLNAAQLADPRLSASQRYPRLAYYRGATERAHRYFGPYPNAWAVKQSIELLQKIFQLRTCEDSIFANRSRPCLLHQIQRCSAPCTGAISPADYARDAAHASALLHGETDTLLHELQQRMMAHADALEYEQAAQIRNQISALSSVLQQQAVQTADDRDADILCVQLQDGQACVNLAMVRAGRHLGDRAYTPSQLASALPLLPESTADDAQPADIPAAPGPQSAPPSASAPCGPHGTQPPAPSHNTSTATEPSAEGHAGAVAAPSAAPPSPPPDAEHNARAAAILHAFIAQHYIDLPIPPLLITSQPLNAELLSALSEQAGHKITATHQPRGQRRIWQQMCQDNARLHLQRQLAQASTAQARTLALAQALGLTGFASTAPAAPSAQPETEAETETAALNALARMAAPTNAPAPEATPPQAPPTPPAPSADTDPLAALTIECFDISHTAGEATQASCVVYRAHQMQRSQYRRYHIHDITPGDDYAAMRQALTRRYQPIARAQHGQPDGPAPKAQRRSAAAAVLPDLILIDGGRGQVSVAREVLSALGLGGELHRIVGVEKGEGRKVGLEELVFADGREKIWLGADNPALLLIAHIRDEAHRFAITGMRAERARTRTGRSALQDIPGIGPTRRARLLQRFGGLRGVAAASVQDLMTVPGISQTLAQTIYAALR